MALPSLAEPSYYTWVDANGIVHNTVVRDDDSAKQKNSAKNESSLKTNNSDETSTVPEEYSDYKSEDELQEQIKSSSDKPFYTWTDASGTIRNDPKPDILVEFTATEIIYDAVFAPPFRLPKQITEGACCIDYKEAFKQNVLLKSSITQKINSKSSLYKTQQGPVPAGYFIFKDIENSILFIKSFKLTKKATFEVIALNSNFQPIHLASKLSGLFIEQTWKDLAYTKIMIEMADPDIEYLIVFVNDESNVSDIGYSLSLSLGRVND